MKYCSECKTEKELESFYVCKSAKDGRQPVCKECDKKRNARYCKNNTKRKDYHKIYNKQRRDKEEVKARNNQYKQDNPEYFRKYNREYRKKHRERLAGAGKDYRQKHKRRLAALKNIYVKKKLKHDPLFRLIFNVRGRTRKAICAIRKKGVAITKKDVGHVLEYLGCTKGEYKVYIESLFELGMSWDNYGNKEGQWSIDHTIPLSSAKTTEELLLLFYYTNTKPMWHVDNVKKNNKIT